MPLPLPPPHPAVCCHHGALPLSLTHLQTLLPRQTTYIPLPASRAANGLFTSFLVAQAPSLVYPLATGVDLEAPTFEGVEFAAVVRVVGVWGLAGREDVAVGRGGGGGGLGKGMGMGNGKGLKWGGEKGEVVKEKVEKRYYVPFGTNRGKFITGARELLIVQKWKEISRWDAEECLRPEGSGIEIGDGEEWREMEGVERLWCASHGVGWECRAWVRVD